VTESYKLDMAPVRASSGLKRRAFVWSLLGMLAIIGVASLGAAADPATGRVNRATGQLVTQGWREYHLVGAFCGLAFVAWTYAAAWNLVYANQRIIDGIAGQVAQIRRERGLDEEGSVPVEVPTKSSL
jgi:hypothetical protein